MRIHVALLIFVLALGASAQVNKSNLVGVIRDSSGAAAPGVTVKIINTGTGAVRQEVTDDSGLYRASLLDVGTYTVEAEKTGFKKLVKPGVLLPVGETVMVDFALEVGALAETVTVSAAGEQLRTETGSIGSTLDTQTIAQLPTIGRNPYVFVALTAGIQYTGDPTAAAYQAFALNRAIPATIGYTEPSAFQAPPGQVVTLFLFTVPSGALRRRSAEQYSAAGSDVARRREPWPPHTAVANSTAP
jgi:hypothetical protein